MLFISFEHYILLPNLQNSRFAQPFQLFTKEVRHAEGHARHSRPRRLGKNDPVRGAFIRLRRTAEARPRRPRRRLSRHRRARARARHHDLFQAGNAVCGR